MALNEAVVLYIRCWKYKPHYIKADFKTSPSLKAVLLCDNASLSVCFVQRHLQLADQLRSSHTQFTAAKCTLCTRLRAHSCGEQRQNPTHYRSVWCVPGWTCLWGQGLSDMPKTGQCRGKPSEDHFSQSLEISKSVLEPPLSPPLLWEKLSQKKEEIRNRHLRPWSLQQSIGASVPCVSRKLKIPCSRAPKWQQRVEIDAGSCLRAPCLWHQWNPEPSSVYGVK